MTSPILLTGGTGTLGRHVVPLLRDAGCEVRVLSRRAHQPVEGVQYATGDLLKGEGIESAVDGAEVVLHLAGDAKNDEVTTRNLVRVASQAGVRHVVYISVIAADRVPLGYFRAKLGAERAVSESGVPWTTLRAAQFHDLVLTVLGKMTKLPVVPAPGAVRLQPVDSREVAARLVELTLDKPAGLVPDLAGPKVYSMPDLVRSYLRVRGQRKPLVPVPMPGKVGRVYRAGGNLTLEGADLGERTWEDFLAERVR
ncbi:NmrA family transcriptional regulator [Wenjunlia vitaminophila]|uniref:NmrA family transcriptional regulator n=1 Tax=Wenjunlia vitaminophila TaxID=76728 RepID=A0A0T6LMS3_WENVI|nr:SDR family oxidoreductase [Wenjunlia vitaminophila]KRV47376.1 NmrA family transcriptional regulator [Wenjunlia vitaminophila]